MEKRNTQVLQKSKEFGGLRPGPPPGVEMDASWIKALGPQKNVPEENLSLLCVAGWEAVKEENIEA